MTINIKIDENEPIRAKSIVPPPDFQSRAVRIRLLMLFGTLVAVIILMKEAGKPDRWKWMGFDQAVNRTGDQLPDAGIGQVPGAHVADQLTDLDENADEDSNNNLAKLNATNPNPSSAQDFWTTSMRKMSSQQQRDFFRFMKELRTSQPLPAERLGDYQRLVDIITSQRARFHREQFDRLALIADGIEEKTRLANELFESQNVWEKKILPAFQAALGGKEFSVSQLQQLNRLQEILDPLALADVQDRTTIGWEGDSTAWVRMWERVVVNDLVKPVPVTHLQLMGQPDFYRGRAVSVKGWVRSAKRILLTDSELGVSQYFLLWVRPADTNVAPYCIYSLNLPAGFPTVSTEFTDLNEHIEATGLFFKIRSYVDIAKEVQDSPVILTNRFEWIADLIPTDVNAWQPSRATLVILFILIPLVATAFAWLVFQGSQTRRYNPGLETAKKIDRTLNDLADDPRVQTNREKIMELYQSDAEQV